MFPELPEAFPRLGEVVGSPASNYEQTVKRIAQFTTTICDDNIGEELAEVDDDGSLIAFTTWTGRSEADRARDPERAKIGDLVCEQIGLAIEEWEMASPGFRYDYIHRAIIRRCEVVSTDKTKLKNGHQSQRSALVAESNPGEYVFRKGEGTILRITRGLVAHHSGKGVNEIPLNVSEIAELGGVSKGRVSQLFKTGEIGFASYADYFRTCEDYQSLQAWLRKREG